MKSLIHCIMMLLLFSVFLMTSAGAAPADDCADWLRNSAASFHIEIPDALINLENHLEFLKDENLRLKSSLAQLTKEQKNIEKELDRRESGFSSIMSDLLNFGKPHRGLSDQELHIRFLRNSSAIVSMQTQIDANVQSADLAAANLNLEALRFKKGLIEGPLQDHLGKFPRYQKWWSDILALSSIEMMNDGKLVTFVPESGEEHEILWLAQELSQLGYLLILDGHSRWASEIIKVAPGALILVAEQQDHLPQDQQVVIRDPYYRWEALSHPDQIITSQGSTLGTATTLFGITTHILDSGNRWSDRPLEKWARRLRQKKRDLNVFDRDHLEPLDAELILSDFRRIKKPAQHTPLKGIEFRVRDLVLLTERVNKLIAGELITEKAAVVLFGSNSEDPDSTPLIYEVGRELAMRQIGLATGGAGGAMLTANRGAFEASGVSIGIPIVGKDQLDQERVVHREVHSHTLDTENYRVRIPLLLHKKNLAVIAPGGQGTLRELAVTLVHMSNPNSDPLNLVFLRQGYYRDLLNWLQRSLNDSRLKERLKLVDAEKEFRSVLNLLFPE